jgi:sortase A
MTMTETRPREAADDGHAANTLTMPGRHRVVHGSDRIRFVMRGVGQALITAGVIVLLFVVYELWVTNIFAHQKQVRMHSVLEQQWAQGDDPLVGRLNLPGSTQSTIPAGRGIANLYVPRLGSDYRFTIVQGVDGASLEEGPGHYPTTQLPGQVGNFAVAGHRVGKGEPFLNLDQLRVGDAVVVETKSTWFVYRVLGDVATGDPTIAGVDGVPGRQIVAPSDVAVIDPVPGRPGARPTESLMTMTTCHPKFTANQRMIVHAALSRTVVRNGNQLPKELVGGTI